MYRKQVWNKSQTYFDGRFNSGAFFIYLTVRPSTDGKRAPLTAINLQAAGSSQQAPPTYIAKMWKLIKFRKNVIFSRNHTDINPDDWTITKKTIRTKIHENFSKMKNLKVDRWALSLKLLCHWLKGLWLCQKAVIILDPPLDHYSVVTYEALGMAHGWWLFAIFVGPMGMLNISLQGPKWRRTPDDKFEGIFWNGNIQYILLWIVFRRLHQCSTCRDQFDHTN